jgi:hypothetical protein
MPTKVTPAIVKFIQSNCTLTPDALSGLILKKFKIQITGRALYPHVERARVEAAADNEAKIEAVRAKILEKGDLRAEKYLKYLDENVEALHKLIVDAKDIKIADVKDLVAVSNSLQKSLCTVLDFVKPSDNNANISINIPESLTDRMKKYEKYYEQMDATANGAPGCDGPR